MDQEFLTVMGVLEDEAQRILSDWQRAVLACGLKGTQTMGIPFHVTLGSYPVQDEAILLKEMKRAAGEFAAVPLTLDCVDTFGDRVLFIKPQVPQALLALHRRFDCSFPYGHPWEPHVTVFCGEEEQVRQARSMLESLFYPFQTRLTALELGRFFPPRFILREPLK